MKKKINFRKNKILQKNEKNRKKKGSKKGQFWAKVAPMISREKYR